MTLDEFLALSHEPNVFGKQHSVIINFYYGMDDNLNSLYNLDKALDQIITIEKVGVYDYHEINMDDTDGRLFMYGPNAESLFKAVKPTLEATDFIRGAIAVLRFGPCDQDVPEIEVEL